MKVLIVGDRPSPRMRVGAKPFEGARSESKLKKWIETLSITHYSIINQVGTPLAHFIRAYNEGAVCIALGNNASQALSKANIKHFKLPHPSGRNRLLNDKDFIDKKLKECASWMREQEKD